MLRGYCICTKFSARCTSYTLAEFAAEISRQSSKPVTYQNLPEAEYKAALLKAGLPEAVATVASESDVGASKEGLFDDGKQSSKLIGRQTAPWESQVKAAVS